MFTLSIIRVSSGVRNGNGLINLIRKNNGHGCLKKLFFITSKKASFLVTDAA